MSPVPLKYVQGCHLRTVSVIRWPSRGLEGLAVDPDLWSLAILLPPAQVPERQTHCRCPQVYGSGQMAPI